MQWWYLVRILYQRCVSDCQIPIHEPSRCLSCDATKTLISAFIFSELDFYSSLPAGAPRKRNLTEKIQSVQNAAARLVVWCRRRHHITPVLYSLHWLPPFTSLASSIMSDSVQGLISMSLLPFWRRSQVSACQNHWTSRPTNSLVSFAHLLLVLLFVCWLQKERRKTFGEMSFSSTVPTVWNSLPFDIQFIESAPALRQTLKTLFFKS